MDSTASQNLARVVRSGRLEEVVQFLECGLGRDRPAELGLGLAMACFLGHREIVRELVKRGAPLNLPTGLADASPLAMAGKGKQKKTIQLLVALGARIPDGFDTGLSDEELAAARAKAKRRRHKQRTAVTTATKGESAAMPSGTPAAPPAECPVTPTAPSPDAPPRRQPPSSPALSAAPIATPPQPRTASRGGIVEEIDLVGCYGVDTHILESEMQQHLPQESPPAQAAPRVPAIDFGKEDEKTA